MSDDVPASDPTVGVNDEFNRELDEQIAAGPTPEDTSIFDEAPAVCAWCDHAPHAPETCGCGCTTTGKRRTGRPRKRPLPVPPPPEPRRPKRWANPNTAMIPADSPSRVPAVVEGGEPVIPYGAADIDLMTYVGACRDAKAGFEYHQAEEKYNADQLRRARLALREAQNHDEPLDADGKARHRELVRELKEWVLKWQKAVRDEGVAKMAAQAAMYKAKREYFVMKQVFVDPDAEAAPKPPDPATSKLRAAKERRRVEEALASVPEAEAVVTDAGEEVETGAEE